MNPLPPDYPFEITVRGVTYPDIDEAFLGLGKSLPIMSQSLAKRAAVFVHLLLKKFMHREFIPLAAYKYNPAGFSSHYVYVSKDVDSDIYDFALDIASRGSIHPSSIPLPLIGFTLRLSNYDVTSVLCLGDIFLSKSILPLLFEPLGLLNKKKYYPDNIVVVDEPHDESIWDEYIPQLEAIKASGAYVVFNSPSEGFKDFVNNILEG